MSHRQHHRSQRDHSSTAHLGEFMALRKAFINCCKEKQDLENRIQQMEKEKSAKMIKMQQFTEILKDKEKKEKKNREMQCKLQDMEKNSEGLCVMFDEALKRNIQMLKVKEQ